MDTLVPKDERDTIDIVSAAIANATPLEISGARTKAGLGRPVTAELRVSAAGMNGVSLYEPSELVLSAGAGTPIREITDLLAQRGQELAFEPIDYGALYGVEAGSGTIGGLIAVNASGPRRIKAGAARDHLLGFRAVSGRAEAFKSGGRVMKNVTGYDLSKLVTGSHGTLAILTEVTVKVLPKAEAEETLLIPGLEDDEAIKVLTGASGLPQEVSSFAHVPTVAAASINGGFSGLSVTALRLEGPPVSIAKRKQDLITHFKARCKEFGSLDAAEFEQLLDSCARRTPTRCARRGHLAHFNCACRRSAFCKFSKKCRRAAEKLVLRLGWRARLAGGGAGSGLSREIHSSCRQRNRRPFNSDPRAGKRAGHRASLPSSATRAGCTICARQEQF